MVLIDSSCWVHYFRHRGEAAVRERVIHLLQQDEAAWCPLIRLELWNGAGSESDRRALRDHEVWVHDLPITDEVWANACALASLCRRRGQIAPATDVLIAACARFHDVTIDSLDAHFAFLMRI
jgi:predicted nucleic acid-binding protein